LKNDAKKNFPADQHDPITLAADIVNTVREPMLVLDTNLRVLQANASFLRHFHVMQEETVGKQVFNLGNGQWDIPRLRELLEKILPEKSVFNDFEVQHAFDKIGQRTFLLNARRIDDKQLILLAMEDVTERQQAEMELREAKALAEKANQAKSEFLANMSHEIRTPMTIFLGAIDHLSQIDQNPDHRSLLKMADQASRQLRSLIDDILDFSRIEARCLELSEEPFDLRAWVRDTVEMFTLPSREKNLRLHTKIAPETPDLVVGDSNRLKQVLVNLLGNAIKFTREGEVSVTVQLRDNFLEFAITDTGIGIPADKHHLLFQSFSQVDSSFNRQYGGSGLGLAISRQLIELMGGQIAVQSREGKGTTVTFSLPLKKATKSNLAPQTRIEYSDDESAPVRILLADDEPVIREVVNLMLTRRGWNAVTAQSGREAIEMWERGNFNVILMDLQMPGIDGMEATRTIRQKETEGTKRTCIIGLTAHVQNSIKDDCLKAGMDQVLTKPVRMTDLHSAITSCFFG
jgi:PAS domain S-box-containing protein